MTSVKFILYTLDTHNQQLKIISDDNNEIQIPSLIIDQLDHSKTIVGIEHILKKIFTQYSKLSFEWIKIKFLDIDIYNDESSINTDIYYCAYIPQETHLLKGYFVDITELAKINPIIRKLICLM